MDKGKALRTLIDEPLIYHYVVDWEQSINLADMRLDRPDEGKRIAVLVELMKLGCDPGTARIHSSISIERDAIAFRMSAVTPHWIANG